MARAWVSGRALIAGLLVLHFCFPLRAGDNPYEAPQTECLEITVERAIEYFESHELAGPCAVLILAAGSAVMPLATSLLDGISDRNGASLALAAWAAGVVPVFWNLARDKESEPYLRVVREAQDSVPAHLEARLKAVLDYLDRPRVLR